MIDTLNTSVVGVATCKGAIANGAWGATSRGGGSHTAGAASSCYANGEGPVKPSDLRRNHISYFDCFKLLADVIDINSRFVDGVRVNAA